jgi:hypothetical protein
VSFKKFIKTKTPEKTADSLADTVVIMQDNIQKSLDFFVNKTQLDSKIVSTTLKAGHNIINHGLNRLLQGYEPNEQNGPSIFWQYKPATDLFLYLYSSNPVAVSILVY